MTAAATDSREERYWTDPTGRRICFAEYGDPAGRPLMFFHGWPSSRLQARILDEACKSFGLRVIAPDRPGLGRSDFAGRRTLREWPPVVAGLADHLGLDHFRVLGVSGGGPYALSCAAWLPDRAERVSVVCGAPPLAEFGDRSDMLWTYRSLLHVRKFAPWLLSGIIGLSDKIARMPVDRAPVTWLLKSIPPEDRASLEDSGGYETYFGTFREAVRQGGPGVVADADVYLGPWGMDFPSIRVPVVFWHGELDRNIPLRMAREIAERIPGSEWHQFDDEGHYSLPLRRLSGILRDLAE